MVNYILNNSFSLFDYILPFLFFILIIKISNIFKVENGLYNGIQKIHQGYTPRFGGIVLFLFFLLIQNEFLLSYFGTIFYFCSFGILFIGLISDLNIDLNPSLRLIILFFIVIFYFFTSSLNYPLIDFPLLATLLNNHYFAIIFFSILVVALINGLNFIDGANGLLSLSLMVSVTILMYVSYNFHLYDHVISLFYLLSLIFIFFIFNYPLGLIFIGDNGAYFLGFVLSLYTISIYSQVDELLSWSAILIFIYPAIELVFSFIRKILIEKKSPLYPDRRHIHILLYDLVNNFGKINKNVSKMSNSLIIFFLSILWLLPFIFFLLFYRSNTFLILLSIIIYILIYIFFYFLTFNFMKKKRLI